MNQEFFNQPTYVIGLMSGTSLDGLDMCYASFFRNESWEFQLLKAETLPYSEEWKTKLAKAHLLDEDELFQLDIEYSKFTREIVKNFIETHDIQNLDLIASHGHTVFHQPENGITFQLGNLMNYEDAMEVPFVCDFRVQDVQLGGQGAPLVPIGDQLLFSEYSHCINIGGFANISFEENGKRIAFDICPANKALNFYTEQLGFPYDNFGEIAQKSKAHTTLVNALNELAYYFIKPPKSLGIEWLEANFYPIVESYQLSTEEKIGSITAHIAFQIARCIPEKARVLITGGGAFNTYLISLIQQQTKAKIHLPQKELINFKEALIFGLIGVLRINNQVNVLSSVTGASKDHSSGSIY